MGNFSNYFKKNKPNNWIGVLNFLTAFLSICFITIMSKIELRIIFFISILSLLNGIRCVVKDPYTKKILLFILRVISIPAILYFLYVFFCLLII